VSCDRARAVEVPPFRGGQQAGAQNGGDPSSCSNG